MGSYPMPGIILDSLLTLSRTVSPLGSIARRTQQKYHRFRRSSNPGRTVTGVPCPQLAALVLGLGTAPWPIHPLRRLCLYGATLCP